LGFGFQQLFQRTEDGIVAIGCDIEDPLRGLGLERRILRGFDGQPVLVSINLAPESDYGAVRQGEYRGRTLELDAGRRLHVIGREPAEGDRRGSHRGRIEGLAPGRHGIESELILP
jgi:hypothetical protein